MVKGRLWFRGWSVMVIGGAAMAAVAPGCSSGDSADPAEPGFTTQYPPGTVVGAQNAEARAQLCTDITNFRNARLTLRDYGCLASTSALLGANFAAQCQSTFEKCQKDVASGSSTLKFAFDPMRCKLDAGCTATTQELEACVTADTAGRRPLTCSTFAQYMTPPECATVFQKCPTMLNMF